MEVVAVLGASSDPNRYSFKALELLKQYGHRPLPIHPREKVILDLNVVSSLRDLINQKESVDTLTMYVNPALSTPLTADILELKPKRVIFNPGTENPPLQKELASHGIKVEEACTLVLLRTGQY
jgi:predicted CoA-binding protein